MGFLDKLRGKKDQESQQQQQQQPPQKETTVMKEEPSSSTSPSGQAGSAGHRIKRYTSEGKPVYD
ncbi:MAG TPA: hypothetical protein VJP79_00875 [Nitrososphaera sp.]|nr:hypothetical protein [Nitrososphaera sp.]